MFGRSREWLGAVKVIEKGNASGRLGWGVKEKEGIAKQNGTSWQKSGKRDEVGVGMEEKSMELKGLGPI